MVSVHVFPWPSLVSEGPRVPTILLGPLIFSRVLRDSTPRFVGRSVGRSVGWSVGRSVPFILFQRFWAFWAYGSYPDAVLLLPTRTRLGLPWIRPCSSWLHRLFVLLVLCTRLFNPKLATYLSYSFSSWLLSNNQYQIFSWSWLAKSILCAVNNVHISY